MKTKYPVLFVTVLIIGCATSYTNSLDVSLNKNGNAKAKLLKIIDDIAKDHNLTKDEPESRDTEKNLLLW